MSGALISATVTRGHFQITWPGGQKSFGYGPTRLLKFAYFKNCCLYVWLPTVLKLGADRFWHTHNNGMHQE